MKSGVPIQLHKKCLIASIQVELSNDLLKLFKTELLKKVVDEPEIKAVVFDLSGLQIIDLYDFDELKKIVNMVKLVGFKTILSGLRPEIISSLIMLDANIEGLVCCANLDEALKIIEENQ